MRIGGAEYPAIALSADRRRILLAGADGVVQAGQAYLGVYRFDEVAVAGDATLEMRDALVNDSQNVAPGAALIKLDIDAPVVEFTSPANLAAFAGGGVVRHVLRFERRHTVAHSTEVSADRGRYPALAGMRSGPTDEDCLCRHCGFILASAAACQICAWRQ